MKDQLLRKSFNKKGWIKARNLKDSDNKIAYVYAFTPKGIREETKTTVRFLKHKGRKIHVQTSPYCAAPSKIIAAIQNKTLRPLQGLAHLGLPAPAHRPKRRHDLSINSQQPHTILTPHQPGSHSRAGYPLWPTGARCLIFRHILKVIRPTSKGKMGKFQTNNPAV